MENFVKQRIRDLLVKMNSNPTQNGVELRLLFFRSLISMSN